MDPTIADVSTGIEYGTEGEGAGLMFFMIYRVNTLKTDATFQIQSTTDLDIWEDFPDTLIGVEACLNFNFFQQPMSG